METEGERCHGKELGLFLSLAPRATVSLTEEEIKKVFLEEGTSEVGLQVKRPRLTPPGAPLDVFSFHLHNNPMIEQ